MTVEPEYTELVLLWRAASRGSRFRGVGGDAVVLEDDRRGLVPALFRVRFEPVGVVANVTCTLSSLVWYPSSKDSSKPYITNDII